MFYQLGKVFNLRFHELLDYPVTLIFMYYEWAVYHGKYELYLIEARAETLGGL